MEQLPGGGGEDAAPEWLEARLMLAPFGSAGSLVIGRYVRFVAEGINIPSPWEDAQTGFRVTPMLRTKEMNSIAVILALVASVACAGLPESQLKIELRKAEDSVELTSTGNAAVVTINSKSGIGSARLLRTGEGWPTRLSIRLNLRGLESFEMENGLIHLRTSLQRGKRTPYWKAGNNEGQADADGALEMTVTTTDGVIEIVVPSEMTDRNPEAISFTWIDFFRR